MKRTTLEQQARMIEDWKRQNGITGRDYVPANNGTRRTASKRGLLLALAKDAAQRGRSPNFPAKF
jgi:hypothetical protein